MPEMGITNAADPIFLAVTEHASGRADASALLRGSYSRQGPDLLITGENGEQIYIITLQNQTRQIIFGGWSANFRRISYQAAGSAPGQYAQLGSSALPSR